MDAMHNVECDDDIKGIIIEWQFAGVGLTSFNALLPDALDAG